MTTSELMQVIGKDGTILYPDGMRYTVRITDARGPNWGRIDYLVQPISGTGSVWVKADRITIQDEVNPCANS